MLEIPEKLSLKFLKSIKWEEIFNIWREGEEKQESWKKHWEERGFSSWEEWRTAYAKPLKPVSLKWALYQIKNPTKDLLFFYGVPSRSWVEKAYGGEKLKQLKEIISLPIISENHKISDIKNNFPKNTMLTAILYEGKIVLIEGMHRAAALASWDSPKLPKSNIFLALALWKEKDIPVIGGNYKDGSKIK